MKLLRQPITSGLCLPYAFAMVADLEPEQVYNGLTSGAPDEIIEVLYRTHGKAFLDLRADYGYAEMQSLSRDLSWVLTHGKDAVLIVPGEVSDHALAWNSSINRVHDPKDGAVKLFDGGVRILAAFILL